MHHHPFLIFKSNPFTQEFLNYQAKHIKTLPIKNFSFFNSTQHSQRSRHNKIHLKKNQLLQNQHSPILTPFQHLTLHKKPSQQTNQNFTIKTSRIKTKKSSYHNLNQKNNIYFDTKIQFKKQPSLNSKKIKITETPKIKQFQKIALTARQVKINSHENTRFCSLNISNGQNRDLAQLKQKLYQSIDFDNLFSKIQLQVSQCDRTLSPDNSSKMKDKLILLDKMKRYSKTPNSKARTVFDQFNLKYLINKRKNFNLKNESAIKGSHLPYFQSFNSYQMKNTSRTEKASETSISLEKMSGRCRDEQGNGGQSRRKNSSLIIIDDHGIVHQQNSQSKDREKMMKKISGKLINMRQMLKIQKIDHHKGQN